MTPWIDVSRIRALWYMSARSSVPRRYFTGLRLNINLSLLLVSNGTGVISFRLVCIYGQYSCISHDALILCRSVKFSMDIAFHRNERLLETILLLVEFEGNENLKYRKWRHRIYTFAEQWLAYVGVQGVFLEVSFTATDRNFNE